MKKQFLIASTASLLLASCLWTTPFYADCVGIEFQKVESSLAPKSISSQRSSVPSKVHLSPKEKEELGALFQLLFKEDSFGYTLFGEKPLSFSFIPIGAPWIAKGEHVFRIVEFGRRSFTKGVNAWEKFQNLSAGENYFLVIHRRKGIPCLAYIVNKRSFIHVFYENIDIFKKYYGNEISAAILLESLSCDVENFYELFDNHLVLGILLGYGRHNAEVFQRIADLSFPTFKVPFSQKQQPSLGFRSVKEELEHLKKCFEIGKNKDPYLYTVSPMAFAMDLNHEKTQMLKDEYDTLHKQLTELFRQDNWVEMILEKLSE